MNTADQETPMSFRATLVARLPLLVLFICLLRLLSVETRGATVDMGFDPNVDGEVLAIAVQSDGKIIIGGNFTTVGGVHAKPYCPAQPDGSLDTDVQSERRSGGRGDPSADGWQDPGRRRLQLNRGRNRGGIARLNSDGSLDTTFNAQNADDWVYAIAVRQDGKILAVGNFSAIGGGTREPHRPAQRRRFPGHRVQFRAADDSVYAHRPAAGWQGRRSVVASLRSAGRRETS